MEKIVVLGGSFNPPTIGHYLLMKSAIKSVNADKGIFLPASQQSLLFQMGLEGLQVVGRFLHCAQCIDQIIDHGLFVKGEVAGLVSGYA